MFAAAARTQLVQVQQVAPLAPTLAGQARPDEAIHIALAADDMEILIDPISHRKRSKAPAFSDISILTHRRDRAGHAVFRDGPCECRPNAFRDVRILIGTE